MTLDAILDDRLTAVFLASQSLRGYERVFFVLVNTCMERLVVHAKAASQLFQRNWATKRVHNHIDSGIFRLLASRCPSNVARRVVSVNVDPIERMAIGGSRPHVFIEGCEVMQPHVCHLDTSAAVNWILGTVWVTTAFFRFLPSRIFWRLCPILFKAVRKIERPYALSLKAAAARDQSLNKVGAFDLLRSAADAFTQPVKPGTSRWISMANGFYCDQTAKLHTGKIARPHVSILPYRVDSAVKK